MRSVRSSFIIQPADWLVGRPRRPAGHTRRRRGHMPIAGRIHDKTAADARARPSSRRPQRRPRTLPGLAWRRRAPMIKYRADIDGLRALAVIPVVLFHAGIASFSGGFIGVDVFFVISGYVISLSLLSDVRNGTFSILNFYERRVRRIF